VAGSREGLEREREEGGREGERKLQLGLEREKESGFCL